MSEAYHLSRLASQLSDQFQIASHGFSRASDDIEECLFAWRDKQATEFAIRIEEPQRETFLPLSRSLMNAQTCVQGLSVLADQAETSLRNVRVQCDPCEALSKDCENKAEIAQYHASEAVEAANRASKQASALGASLKGLGAPPI